MKKEHTIEKEILEREAPVVLQSIPNPFGSFEKAKYEIKSYSGRGTYSFITTCHNSEDVIEMMKKRFGYDGNNNFTIHKTVEGVKKLIFHQYKNTQTSLMDKARSSMVGEKKYNAVRDRIKKYGWPVDKALSTPVRKYNYREE